MPPVAVVRDTSDALAYGLVTHMEREEVEVGLARRQHAAYCDELARAGFEIHPVESAPEHPDAVFVEDTAVVVGRTAVITRPGAPERRGETVGTETVLSGLGLSIRRIEDPGTLDGGDVLQVGSTVYVGRGGRTNAEGVRQLRQHVRASGHTVVPVRLQQVLHLKSAVTALPDHTLLSLPELFEPGALPAQRPVAEEAGCHVVPLDEETVLISASAPRTAELVRDLGFSTRVVDISEFEKREGCVTCLSILLPGRE